MSRCRTLARPLVPRGAIGLLVLVLLAGCGSGGGGGIVRGKAGVQAIVDALSGTTATLFQFTGQASDLDGGAVAYAWDFDEDGEADANTRTASFTFASPGSKRVRLTATDPDGTPNVAELTLNVLDAMPPPSTPAVALEVWTLHASAPAEVFCRARAEDPDGGGIVEYAFDFDGDGTDDVVGASATAGFTLLEPGRYPVRVTVTDAAMETATAQAFVVLCEGPAYPDHAPSCQIELPGGSAMTPTNTPIRLIACGADLDGGAVTNVAWDLDDDGVFGDQLGRVIDPSFAQPGVHRVRVRLTDDELGAPSEAQVRILVADAAVDLPPAAWARAQALAVAPAQAVQFQGRGADAEDQALSYAWDFDGDGVSDAATADAAFAFALPGVYRPRLTVEDVDGKRSSADLTVLVEPCPTEALSPFRYGGATVALLQGGATALALPPSRGAATTLKARLVYQAGAADDPEATALDVRDADMAAPPTAPIDVDMAGAVLVDLTSLVPPGGGGRELYTVGVRIEDPGVRVQVLSFDVDVIDAISASLFVIDNHPVFVDEYYAALQVSMNAAGAVGLPSIHEIEIVFADQTPAWLEAIPGGPALLPFGWSESVDAVSLRFSTMTNPVPMSGSGPTFQFRFDTAAPGPGMGPAPTAGEVRLYDGSGSLIVTVPLDISGV